MATHSISSDIDRPSKFIIPKYITNRINTLGSKDEVEIKGSRSSYGDEQVLIAAEVKKGNYFLKIWDDKEGLVSKDWFKQ